MGRSVMNIQPISYYNVSMQGKFPPKRKGGLNKLVDKCTQKILNIFNEVNLKDDFQRVQKLEKMDTEMSHPAINRVIMGATAIFLQPAIDASNKDLDKDTRILSVCRTIAKIIAGTFVGIIVRGASHRVVTKMTNIEGKAKHCRKLLPKSYIETFKKNPVLLKNYRSALSTGIAILAMCVTNFVFDAPLTVKLTNKFKNFVDTLRAKSLEKNVEVAHG